MSPRDAHQCNLDVAQRELDRRSADGEDVSHLVVDERTAQIVERPPLPEVLRAARDAFAADLARRSHEERERGRRLLYAGMSRSRRRSSY